MSETMDHFDTKQDQLFEQILMPDTTNTVRSHGKKFQVTVEKKPLGSWVYRAAKDEVLLKLLQGNGITFSKQRVRLEMLITKFGLWSLRKRWNSWKIRKIKERKEKIYVAGSNIRRSQHSNDISLKVESLWMGTRTMMGTIWMRCRMAIARLPRFLNLRNLRHLFEIQVY